MQIPIKLDKDSKYSLKQQIVSELINLISSGKLPANTKIPSTRELSAQINVSRNTVLSAYNELIEHGYLKTNPAGGTFVCLPKILKSSIDIEKFQTNLASNKQIFAKHHSAEFTGLYKKSQQKSLYNFTLEQTDSTLFPVKTWRRLLNQRIGQIGGQISKYGDPSGLYELRQAIHDFILPSRGISCMPEQVVITSGNQQALSIIAHLFIKYGSKVIVEEPTYSGALYLFRSYGANIIPIEVDTNGIKVDDIPTDNAQFAFVTPTHQSPLGVTLSFDRRSKLINWSNNTGSYIVELDYDAEFWYEGSPLPALMGISQTEHVIYIQSFSKLLGPGLRLGFMVVPSHLVSTVSAIKALLDNGNPWLEQAVMVDFIKSGSYEWHLKKISHKYKRRRDIMLNALHKYFGKIDVSGLNAGSHLVWRIPNRMKPAHKLVDLFKQKQVAISTLNQFDTTSGNKIAKLNDLVFLGFSAVDDNRIEEGIKLMSTTLNKR